MAAVALVVLLGVALPSGQAVAACPGCDEYTFNLPNDSGGDEPVAPTPAPAAPVTPTYVPPAVTTTPAVPVAPAPEPPKPDPEKPGDLVASKATQGIAPIALSPIDPSRTVAASSDDSMLPLVLVIGGVTVVALIIGLRRRTVRS